MPPASSLKLEQERTRKLKEEVEQMEQAAKQLVAVTSTAGSVQTVTFSGLGTASTSIARPNPKQVQSRTKPANAKATQKDSVSKPQHFKASTVTHASHGPITSARLASSSSSGASKAHCTTALPPKASAIAAKPNPIKSPLPAITSRPSSGSNSNGHAESQSKPVPSKGQRRVEPAASAAPQSGRSSKSNSQMSSRRSSVDSREEATAARVGFEAAAHPPQHASGGHVLRLAPQQGKTGASATDFLMRDGTSFTLGKDIFLKEDIPISTACDMAIGSDTQLDSEVLDAQPGDTSTHSSASTPAASSIAEGVGTAVSAEITTEQTQKQKSVHFSTAPEDTCAAANDMDNPTSYFVQIEKALVLKSLVESVKTQETPEERHERLMKLAMQDSLAPITDVDDDIVEQITITPADIMAELASQVN